MRLAHWGLLVGVMTTLGMAKVAQQTAIWQQAYEAGRQASRLHVLENETQWLSRTVIALESPTQLARAIERQHLKLVARSALVPSTPGAGDAKPALQLSQGRTQDE